MKPYQILKKTHPFTLVVIRSKDQHPWEHILMGTPDELLKKKHLCLKSTVDTQLLVTQKERTALMIIVK